MAATIASTITLYTEVFVKLKECIAVTEDLKQSGQLSNQLEFSLVKGQHRSQQIFFVLNLGMPIQKAKFQATVCETLSKGDDHYFDQLHLIRL